MKGFNLKLPHIFEKNTPVRSYEIGYNMKGDNLKQPQIFEKTRRFEVILT